MGRVRKKNNLKARVSGNNISEPESNYKSVVKLDLDVREEQYDASNALVLPSGKKKHKVKENHCEFKKPLSKKERKRLQKILDKKIKKNNRAELFDKLKMVQATPAEAEHLTSTSVMQTLGLKRYSAAESHGIRYDSTVKINNVKGSKKRKHKDFSEDENKNIHEDASSTLADSDVEDSDDEIEESEKPVSEELPISASLCEKNSPTDKNKSVEKPIQAEEAKQEIPVVHMKMKCEPTVFVPVERSPEIQAAREKLPIYSEEQSIMEAIKENAVVVIQGATGSGKTTQVPQFLYEAGYTKNGKMIGITEPRRIAAVSMAARVAEEMNHLNAVSYHIRYDKTTSSETEIKFMTDGILLREIRHDFLLKKYSVVIVDEAHERTIYSDVLIGLLSRILKLRQKKGAPLKVIIMSATLRVEDFTSNPKLFEIPPKLLKVESRQYDVVLHFNKQTPSDYIEAAYKKFLKGGRSAMNSSVFGSSRLFEVDVCRIIERKAESAFSKILEHALQVYKIHRELPAGGILVFVSGADEVKTLCRRLRKAFPFPAKKPNRPSKRKRKKMSTDQNSSFDVPILDLDNYSAEPVKENSDQLSDEEDDEEATFGVFQALHVLPLYSVLSTDEQRKVFKPPPDDSRLCVVATNIAETSITIPGLKYVVDTGKVKTRIYNQTSDGISQFIITWTAKASANQRAGRAGRTEGGHCYRLYSSAVFEHEFPAFTPPDIQKIPVDDVLLQMKALGINLVVNFPFPSPPNIDAIKSAEKRLVMLGALENVQKGQRLKDIKKWEFAAKATTFGKCIANFPVSPRYGKMLLLSLRLKVVPYIIALVAALSVPELFLSSPVPSENEDSEIQEKKQWIGIKKIGAGTGKSLKLGDPMVMLRAIIEYSETPDKVKFCTKYGVQQKAMLEIDKMRQQLTKDMNEYLELDARLPMDKKATKMSLPSDEEVEKIRKILAGCLIDHVARKVPTEELGKENKKLKNAYRCLDTEEFVFIHPSSILFDDAPEFVVYQQVFQTSKYYMKGIIEIEPEWIPCILPDFCEFSLPVENPAPYYDEESDAILCGMTSSFGRWNWKLPCVVKEMPVGVTKYNWFCYFLLDGQVLPFFKKYKKFLLFPASNIFKSWAKIVTRIKCLLQAVMSKEVYSKAALLKEWEEDSKFLLEQYLNWIPQVKHEEISKKWPPVS